MGGSLWLFFGAADRVVVDMAARSTGKTAKVAPVGTQGKSSGEMQPQQTKQRRNAGDSLWPFFGLADEVVIDSAASSIGKTAGVA